MSISSRFLGLPEVHIAIFSYLLNFQWELFQMPLFSGFNGIEYYDAILHCTQATFGDVVISLIAFLAASAAVRSRRWLLEDNGIAIGVFFLTGLMITVCFELLATGPLNRWEYADIMPLIPFTGVGVSPVAQWVLIPALVVWFSRRQLRANDARL